VADLAAAGPFAGLELPLATGRCRLAPLPEPPRAILAPFRRREAEVAARLGIEALPPPGQLAELAGGRLLWIGIGQWLAERLALPDLGDAASLTDQSDAFAGLALAGADAAEVLARLVPLDLAPAFFPPGRAARSLLRHVPLVLIATAEGFELLVPRSYARTAFEELGAAMRSVAARAALGERQTIPQRSASASRAGVSIPPAGSAGSTKT
jgi:sarcosine oxidase subunit gamma